MPNVRMFGVPVSIDDQLIAELLVGKARPSLLCLNRQTEVPQDKIDT